MVPSFFLVTETLQYGIGAILSRRWKVPIQQYPLDIITDIFNSHEGRN
jgi:hypothetical protein